MKLTRNFSKSEFDSRDGAAMPENVLHNVMELAQNLQIIRDEIGGKPITINSGYRSPDHNASVGGSSGSYHLEGMAADIVVKGMTPSQVHQAIYELMMSGKIEDGGLKEYSTFVHYDIRGYYVTW
jgi:uncharacterized protein YcbK (DUF882 family)